MPLALAIFALAAFASCAAWADPAVEITQRTILMIATRPLTARPLDGELPGPLRLEPDQAGETRLLLGWPGPADRCAILLRMRALAPPADGGQAVDVRAEVVLADGRKAESARLLRFSGRATQLFEVYRRGEQSLTLALEAAEETEPALRRRSMVGQPVRFQLEVVRVLEGREVPLESNVLGTFVGEAVSYSFRLGEQAEAEGARVSLRPVRVSGEVLEVEVEISGSLPSADEWLVLGRRERWLASREARSVLAFESGTPPTGYRFVVSARF